jgi:DNA-binding LacI/PurR family transcriptional regulator
MKRIRLNENIITIKDVAERAGVSIGTVSNVINGSQTVKQVNKEKVLKAMEDLQFIPNMTAQCLKTNQSKTIGLVLPTIVNPFFAEVVKGVEDTANTIGYTSILCNTDRNKSREERYIEMLISKRAAGVIIFKSELSEDEISNYSRRIKIVLIDRGVGMKPNVDMIDAANYEGVVKAVEYLNELNHSKIAYITGTLISQSDADRLKGYKDTLIKNSIVIMEDYIRQGDFTWESGFQLGKELLKIENPPTAICCSNDMMAIGVIKAAAEMGIKVPEELSVIGFDNIDICELITPNLTTINHPKYEQGQKAAKVLFDAIKQGDNHTPQYNVVSTELKIRNSTTNNKKRL